MDWEPLQALQLMATTSATRGAEGGVVNKLRFRNYAHLCAVLVIVAMDGHMQELRHSEDRNVHHNSNLHTGGRLVDDIMLEDASHSGTFVIGDMQAPIPSASRFFALSVLCNS